MGAFCNGAYTAGLEPGQMCPDGKTIATGPKEKTTPASQNPDTVTGKIPWNADSSRVLFGSEPGRPALGAGAGTVPTSISVYDITRRDSKGWLTNLKANNPDGYDDLIALLRSGGFLGSRAKSSDSIRRAVDSAAKEAAARYDFGQSENVDFLDYLYSRVGSDDSTGNKSGKYTGPVESRTIQAESDIRATANALAIELIGRPVSDKELNKLVERMRSAEMQQPNITRSTTGATTTKQGLTAQGREDILREVIAKNPEYEKFQVDTTVLDAMTDFIDKKKQVSGG
jgi:hypothetical protein